MRLRDVHALGPVPAECAQMKTRCGLPFHFLMLALIQLTTMPMSRAEIVPGTAAAAQALHVDADHAVLHRP